MRCALGLVMHKLGLNFYETEEMTESLAYLKKSFELMDSIADNLKLRHLNAVQDLYNHIGIILSDRDSAEEALGYLERAKEIYLMVVEHTKELPQRTVMRNFDLFLLKKSKGEHENFSFYINSGLDLKKLEQKYTTTLFILAQVYSKMGNIDDGMKYCGITMQRQLKANEYDLKDWVVNATTLAEAFLSREHFS
jgi:tetratricopeptide (TPR) repeat protein